MKKIIIGVVFVVCLFFASFTGYYIGTKSAHTTVIEETTEVDVDELRNSIKAEVYADAYNEGYEKCKTEVFQLMLEEEEQEEYDKKVQELEEELEELNNKSVETTTKPTNNNGNTDNNQNNQQPQEEVTKQETTESQTMSNDYAGNICPYCGGTFTDSEFRTHIQTHR